MGGTGRPASVIVTFVLFLTLSGVLVVSSPQKARAQGPVGGVGPWTEQTDYGASSGANGSGGIAVLGQSCIAYNGSVYCVGGQDSGTGTDVSNVYYAPVSISGTVGAWNETTDYGALSDTSGAGGIGVEWPSCVQSDGYIYCFGGSTSTSPSFTSKSFYARLSSSGVGPWIPTTDYGADSGYAGDGGIATDQLACVADGGYAYCTGGDSGTSKVFFAQLTANGLGPWTETTDYGAATGSSGAGGVAIGSNACADESGYIYCVGGTVSSEPVSDVFYAAVNSSGVGAWTETVDYGASSGSSGIGGVPVHGTSCVPYSADIICVAGDTTGNASTGDVFYATAAPGSPSAWVEASGYPQVGYWDDCIALYDILTCAGGGSSVVNTAPVEPASSSPSSTTSSSSSLPSPSTVVSATTSQPSSSSETAGSVTSSSSAPSPSTTSAISSGSSTSPLTTSTDLGLLPDAAIVVVALAAFGALILVRRRGDAKTPPPDMKSPPNQPVMSQGHPSQKKQEGCDVNAKSSDISSRFRVNVDVSDYWWNRGVISPTENSDLVARMEETVRKDEDWDQDAVGTAVAASDGAAVGGSVDAGAKVWIIGQGKEAVPLILFNGQQRMLEATARGAGRVPIEARMDGQTEIDLEVEAAPGFRTAISAAVLAAVKASATVSDPGARLLAYLERLDALLRFTELLDEVAKRIVESGGAKNYLAYRNALGELNALIQKLKTTVTPAEGANLTKEGAEKAVEIFEEFGPVYEAEMAEFVVPYLVETVGKWYFADADVDVEVEGSIKFNVGSCKPASIEATASMELEVKGGGVEKPGQYANGKLQLSDVEVRRAVGSCSALREVKIGVEGSVITKGRAFDGGEGNGFIDSLWAAAWVWGCEGPREEVGALREVNFDCAFGARFVLPQAVRDQYPDTKADELRDTIADWMRDRLDALLNAAGLSRRLPSPLDDPEATQGALEDILESWLREIQEKWSLFAQ
ncbi:MAG: hypothetical protein OK456_00860 [Thaumarchaeota archaeon]|nr:hypothetical protein [Nitrososphaerota archaeon]